MNSEKLTLDPNRLNKIKILKIEEVTKVADIALENLLPKAGNSVYRLMRMAANRAIELAEGKPKLIKNASSDKETTTALEEIAEGKIMIKDQAERKSKDERKSGKS